MSDLAEKILVVEDDPEVLEYYRMIFDITDDSTSELDSALSDMASLIGSKGTEEIRQEYNVTLTNQGLSAIHEACRSRKEGANFSHALVDMRLPPGIDGLETATCLWEMNPEIDITFVTAYTDHQEATLTASLPAGYRMIRKPFSKEDILQLFGE